MIMALQAAYKQFLAAPNPSFLAEDASLHYITTLNTLNGASGIIKHLKSQDHDLKKKEELFLDVVEGSNSLAVETHTTIEFLTGGGSYLPSLDDNFLTDRIVTFPIVSVRKSRTTWPPAKHPIPQIHIVGFDTNGKILQIRQSWDQGSLLKLIDVIGKTGRNWPIHDGKDQIKLITSSVKSFGKVSADSAAEDTVSRSRGNSNNVTRDPHASLSLFAPREKNVQDSLPAVVAHRPSARPAPREYSELFVGNDSDTSPAAPSKGPRERSESPTKTVASKIGAGKNFAPSRLFDNDENSPIRPTTNKEHSADHLLRANPAKYQHFDFADGSDPRDTTRPTPVKDARSQRGSQWNFDDFHTPAKVIPSKILRSNDVRHWGNHSDEEPTESPIKIKRIDKPRKDAETHFEFQDDGTSEPRQPGRPRGAGQNTGLGLYNDHLFNEEEEAESEGFREPKTLTGIANTKDRRKDFDPQFSMTHDSPASKQVQVPEGALRDDRAKAVKMMDANWSSYNQSPDQKENQVPISPTRPSTETSKGPLSETTNAVSNRSDQPKGITVAGDGMSHTKGAGSGFTDKGKGVNVGGDSMGGKKGSGRAWGFGDESGGEEAGGNTKPSKYITGKQGKVQATGGDFWDF